MDGLYWALIVIAILVSITMIFLIMASHDINMDKANTVNSMSCEFIKNFLIGEEGKYFKHLLYDEMVKKVNSPECVEKP